MKWTLGFGGAVAGFVCAVVFMIGLGVHTSVPGGYELLLQGAIVIYISSSLGGLGFCVGCLIDLCRRMMPGGGREMETVSRELPAMRKWVRIIGASCTVGATLSFLAILALIGLVVEKATGTGMYPREVAPREVKLAFRRVTDRKLPKSAANLRAILGNGRPGVIFVRFEADQQAQDDIVALFADQGAALRELDSGELAELKRSSSAFFSEAVAWQNELGIDLYVPSSLRSARMWEGKLKSLPRTPGEPGYDVLYQVLIDRDSGVAYILAASLWAD